VHKKPDTDCARHCTQWKNRANDLFKSVSLHVNFKYLCSQTSCAAERSRYPRFCSERGAFRFDREGSRMFRSDHSTQLMQNWKYRCVHRVWVTPKSKYSWSSSARWVSRHAGRDVMLEISKTWMRHMVYASLTFATIKPGCIPYVDLSLRCTSAFCSKRTILANGSHFPRPVVGNTVK